MMTRKWPRPALLTSAALLAATLLNVGCWDRPVTPESPAPPTALPAPPAAPGRDPATSPSERCASIARIEVWKSSHTLRAYCTDGDVFTMQVALGRNPEGAKLRSGDRRTPEGAYAIAGPARSSRFHRFIPIDYPSAADAARALADGRVDREGYERIVAAHERGQPPPQNTPLGGYIGLHGEGELWAGDSAVSDWTFGCIGVSDADIDWLAARIAVGVPVEIHP